MFRLALPLVAIATAWLMGCQREPSTTSKPREAKPAGKKPFLVKTNAGIDHEFYREVSLDDFLKLLPTGAIDSVDLNIGNGPQVFALVKVPDQPDRDLAKVRFETTFKTRDGQVIDKQWTAAKDRKSGKAAAVFCLPPSVVDGETKVVPSSD